MSEKTTRNLVLLAVVAITAAVHVGCLSLDFNSFWDLICVYRNPFQSPITFTLAGRAFIEYVEGDYRPISLLSNSLDYTLWGFNPSGHHLTSYLLFLVNTVLVFLVIERLMTCAGHSFSWRIPVAGLTALLFGIHPMKAQVVAWVTAREHLLYACFYLLCILAYTRWCRLRVVRWYMLAVLCALFAGLSKVMSISLPVVLFLLDYYPLARCKDSGWRRALYEKIPFCIIALAALIRSVQIVHHIRIMHPTGLLPLLRNLYEYPAIILFYIYKTVLPVGLAPIYPVDLVSNHWLAAFSWAIMAGLLVLAFAGRKKHPAFITGALISMIAVLPTGGLIRVGATVLADRYVQLATIPLLLLIAWYIVEAVRAARLRWAAISIACTWALFIAWKTVSYTALWDDAVGLTRVAYDRYPDSGIIELFMLRTYNNVATSLAAEGKFDEAVDSCRKAIEINPVYPDTYTQLGIIHCGEGRHQEGIAFFARAVELSPRDIDAHFNLGLACRRAGRSREAVAAFERALELDPSNERARAQLAELK